MANSQKSPKKVVKTTQKKVVKTTSSEAASTDRKRPMPAATISEKEAAELPFTRTNYVLLIAGIAVILFGFILMSIGDFVDATQFSVALYIAPVLVVGGFIEIIFAIMYRPASDLQEQQSVSDPA